jgi:beta-N-acetylhexosaminidase
MDQVELAPFRAAIAEGVDSIMTAHIAVPALDPSGDPATLSKPLLTGLLRKEMKFGGLIVTDALDMGGIAKGFGAGEAAVRALEAGADVLLMPPQPVEAIDAVYAAVRKGRLSVARIDQSVARVLRAKEHLGLHRRRLVDLEALFDVLDSPEASRRAQETAERAVTLVTNSGGTLPLRPDDKPCFVILAESRRSTQGQAAADEIRRRTPSAPVIILDPSVARADIEAAARTASACGKTVVAAFVSVAAYRGNTALAGSFPELMELLLAGDNPVAFVALGNPYLIQHFPKVAAYLVTFSTVPPSEIAAVKVLFGEIPARGRLPITIPGIAARGAGLE